MARHTPEGDDSFTRSLVRHVGAAVALVVVVAAAFWGVGQMQGDDVTDDPVVASGPTEPTPTADATGQASPDATPTDGTPTDAGTTPTPTETAAAPDEEPEPDPDPEPEPTASEPVPSGQGDIDPAEISVQVLDAVLDDGGEAAARVADQLDSDGFRLVARNKAVRRYDVTTVFYTPGNEAKAQRIAAQYGYHRVEPQPGNLSNSVDVHLVVGTDA